jgi:RNA polymerase sigma-70 factor (sigma-E family)
MSEVRGRQGFPAFAALRATALIRYAYVLCGDAHAAEDLVQEALIKAHARWGRITRMAYPEAYVRQMILNQFLGGRRRRQREVVGLAHDADVRPAHVTEPVYAVVERSAMWDLLATLPRQQRAATVLRYYEDLDDDAIAVALNCSTATVRKHVSLALRKLRAQAGEGQGKIAERTQQ